MKYAYFPGCSLHSSAEEYNRSAKAVSEALGIELREVPDWICCGATPAHITNHLLSLALPLSNCTWAEREGLDLVACCAACFHRLKMANLEVEEDSALLSTVNEVIGENYQGKVKVLHFLEVLSREVGLKTIRKRVKRPLKGLKVVSYYGCLLTRLPQAVRIDSAENPMIMDELITALGAEAIDWPYKTECCGASLAVIQKKTVIRLAHDILRIARDRGAECVAVACPLCQSNLDLCQKGVERKYRTKLNLPVFYFTQLVGLALGLDKEKLGLEKLIVDPTKLLEGKGLI
jgi:heterodisulfide reductase subunit B